MTTQHHYASTYHATKQIERNTFRLLLVVLAVGIATAITIAHYYGFIIQ